MVYYSYKLRFDFGNFLVGGMLEISRESELALRLGTTVAQVRKWASEGKFNKNIRVTLREDLVYINYPKNDTVNQRRRVDRILDEMDTARPHLA